jgi:hypothetical protein
MHRILHLPLSCWTDALTHEEGACSDAATSLPQHHGADTETASEEPPLSSQRSLSSLSSERTLSSQPDHHHAAALPLSAGAHFACLTRTKVQILIRAHEQRGRRREERRREESRCTLTAVIRPTSRRLPSLRLTLRLRRWPSRSPASAGTKFTALLVQK